MKNTTQQPLADIKLLKLIRIGNSIRLKCVKVDEYSDHKLGMWPHFIAAYAHNHTLTLSTNVDKKSLETDFDCHL